MGRGVSGDVKAAPKEKAEVKTDAISAPKMEQAEPKPEPKADVNPPPTPPTVQALADDKTRSADNLPTCWGCGAVQPPLPAKKFQSCARCREDGLPPSHFCSKECFKTNWPRHKQWHAEQKSQRGDAGEADSNNAKEKAVLSTLRGVLKDQPKSDVKRYEAFTRCQRSPTCVANPGASRDFRRPTGAACAPTQLHEPHDGGRRV